MNSPKFWISDYKELFNEIYLFPNQNMTKNQILNSLTRYSILIIILFFFINSNSNWYYLPVGIIISCLILYLLDFRQQKEDKKQEILNKIKCQKPDINNPYMNVLVTQDEERLPACDSRDEEVSKLTDKYYKFNLYQNGEDIFDKKNMERQFYTMPSSTIPNDQNQFVNWLYKNESNCKTNTEMCLPYEDKRYH